METRKASLKRETKETSIEISLNLDGSGEVSVSTGFGFADHMLTLLGFWGGLDLRLNCKGDLEVDAHHTLEDTGLCLGRVLRKCLGDGSGIGRVGWARVPMDEAMADVAVDISGRPYLVYSGELLPPIVAGEEKDLWREFFKSLAFSADMNLHIMYLYGNNGHHLLESAFKGLGLALRQAVRPGPVQGAFSTKGSLDS